VRDNGSNCTEINSATHLAQVEALGFDDDGIPSGSSDINEKVAVRS
jgi:hypothetical protein